MQRSLAASAVECGRLFNSLSSLLHDSQCESRSALRRDGVEDQAGRFRIWGGNLGAFQSLPATSSLDYRLRESPKIAMQIQELLSDLQEALQNVSEIASGEKPNRQYQSDDDEDDDFGEDVSNDDATNDDVGDQPVHLSEAGELFESVKETIASLFRLSIIIRKASPRDRFAKSLLVQQNPFDVRFDIAHVGQKYPLLANDKREWLRGRLGRAITQRRQFLRYARDHREKLSKEPADLWEPEIDRPEPSVQSLPVDWGDGSQTGKTNTTKPTSTMAPTTASTLYLIDTPNPDTDFADNQSQTSYAPSMGEGDEQPGTQLPQLSDVSKGASVFECPLCWTIQSVKKESSWRKHVFSDLRPYVCTFEGCDMKLFSDRREWFEHELNQHRVQWHCHFCDKDSFESLEGFQTHLRLQHAQTVTDSQLDAITEASKRSIDLIPALNCPFCIDWEKNLRHTNPDISSSDVIAVTPNQFRSHVGSHMESLALFAIPRGHLEDGADADSAASVAAEGGMRDSLSNATIPSNLGSNDTVSGKSSAEEDVEQHLQQEIVNQKHQQDLLDQRKEEDETHAYKRPEVVDLKRWIRCNMPDLRFNSWFVAKKIVDLWDKQLGDLSNALSEIILTYKLLPSPRNADDVWLYVARLQDAITTQSYQRHPGVTYDTGISNMERWSPSLVQAWLTEVGFSRTLRGIIMSMDLDGHELVKLATSDPFDPYVKYLIDQWLVDQWKIRFGEYKTVWVDSQLEEFSRLQEAVKSTRDFRAHTDAKTVEALGVFAPQLAKDILFHFRNDPRYLADWYPPKRLGISPTGLHPPVSPVLMLDEPYGLYNIAIEPGYEELGAPKHLLEDVVETLKEFHRIRDSQAIEKLTDDNASESSGIEEEHEVLNQVHMQSEAQKEENRRTLEGSQVNPDSSVDQTADDIKSSDLAKDIFSYLRISPKFVVHGWSEDSAIRVSARDGAGYLPRIDPVYDNKPIALVSKPFNKENIRLAPEHSHRNGAEQLLQDVKEAVERFYTVEAGQNYASRIEQQIKSNLEIRHGEEMKLLPVETGYRPNQDPATSSDATLSNIRPLPSMSFKDFSRKVILIQRIWRMRKKQRVMQQLMTSFNGKTWLQVLEDYEPFRTYPQFLDFVARDLVVEVYQSGQCILKEGHTSPWLCWLVKGEVYRLMGGHLKLDFLEYSGSWFSDIGTVLDKPEFTDFIAAKSCIVVQLRKRDLLKAFRAYPKVEKLVVQVAEQRFKSLENVRTALPPPSDSPEASGLSPLESTTQTVLNESGPAEKGADPAAIEFWSTLINCGQDIRIGVAKAWLQKQSVLQLARITATTSAKYNALALAARFGDIELAKVLLSFGAVINLVMDDGNTALDHAMRLGNNEFVNWLRTNGATTSGRSTKSRRPGQAFRREFFHLISTNPSGDQLIEVEGRLRLIQDRYGETEAFLNQIPFCEGQSTTPLMKATKLGNARLVKVLIANGANVNAQTAYGSHALSSALAHEKVDIVGILLRNGANEIRAPEYYSDRLLQYKQQLGIAGIEEPRAFYFLEFASRHKSLDGTLSVYQEHKIILWEPITDGSPLKIAASDISSVQKSPATAAKIGVKITTKKPPNNTPENYVFVLTSSSAREDQAALLGLLVEVLQDRVKEDD